MLIFLFCVYFIYFLSFFYTTLSNPGIPEFFDPHNATIDMLPKDACGIEYCEDCHLYSPKFRNKKLNSKHCRYCDVCIQSKIITIIFLRS